MDNASAKNQSLFRQIGHFIIHLRWHYQVFILSGGFLLGGYFSRHINWTSFVVQFINIHLLLFGGATAYNSYWDKDKGPVGGLEHPPPMHQWMWIASLVLQCIGLLIAMQAGWTFTLIYSMSVLCFWLYSSPHFRWKAHPLRSLIAIGISTGTNSLLLGYLAAGSHNLLPMVWIAAAGVAFIILSLYPASQIFQIDEDQSRGYQTFAIEYGTEGVIRFFRINFAVGLLLTGLSIASKQVWMGGLFLIFGMATGLWVNRQLGKLRTELINYTNIMRIKYVTSVAFISFILCLLIFNHAN